MASDIQLAASKTRRIREVLSKDGTRLSVEEFGLGPDAPLLVFSHGWACQGRFWRPQIEHFAESNRVVVYDQRGHGASDRGRTAFAPAALGDDLEAVLRAVVTVPRKALVVGHSMGGMSVMAWADGHPDSVKELVRGAVLASTGPSELVSKSTLIGSRPPLRARLERVFGASLAVAGPEMPNTALTRRFVKYGTMGRHAQPDVVAECCEILLQCPPSVRAGWGGVLATIDVGAGLNALSVPTTVAVGDADKLTPQAHSVEIVKRLELHGWLHEAVTIPHVGHMINLEAPQAFNGAVSRLNSAVSG